MRKIVTPALLAGAALLAAFGFASATEDRAAAGPAAPSLVRELPATGTATVAGIIAELQEDGLVLADPEGGKLRVDAEHLRLAALAPGEMITVTGRGGDGGPEGAHLRVGAERLRLAGLAPGEMITRPGRVGEGGLGAGHAGRADGTGRPRDPARGEDEGGEEDGD